MVLRQPYDHQGFHPESMQVGVVDVEEVAILPMNAQLLEGIVEVGHLWRIQQDGLVCQTHL